jgi:hypothetical protein
LRMGFRRLSIQMQLFPPLISQRNRPLAMLRGRSFSFGVTDPSSSEIPLDVSTHMMRKYK